MKFDTDTALAAFKQSYSEPGYSDNSISVAGEIGNSPGHGLQLVVENISSATNPPVTVGVGSYQINKADFQMSVTYEPVGGGYYIADNSGQAPDSSHYFTINITAIDNISVKGTFSGKIYIDNNIAGQTPLLYGPGYKTITNGTFYVGWR
jgi:hypothetical protein